MFICITTVIHWLSWYPSVWHILPLWVPSLLLLVSWWHQEGARAKMFLRLQKRCHFAEAVSESSTRELHHVDRHLSIYAVLGSNNCDAIVLYSLSGIVTLWVCDWFAHPCLSLCVYFVSVIGIRQWWYVFEVCHPSNLLAKRFCIEKNRLPSMNLKLIINPSKVVI